MVRMLRLKQFYKEYQHIIDIHFNIYLRNKYGNNKDIIVTMQEFWDYVENYRKKIKKGCI